MELVICCVKKLRLTKLYSICIRAQMVTNFSLCSQCVLHWQKHAEAMHAYRTMPRSDWKQAHTPYVYTRCLRLYVALLFQLGVLFNDNLGSIMRTTRKQMFFDVVISYSWRTCTQKRRCYLCGKLTTSSQMKNMEKTKLRLKTATGKYTTLQVSNKNSSCENDFVVFFRGCLECDLKWNCRVSGDI